VKTDSLSKNQLVVCTNVLFAAIWEKRMCQN